MSERSELNAGDGARLSYWQVGDGPRDLLIIHGWMVAGDTFAPLVGELSRAGALAGWRATVFDMRGTGESDSPATGYDHPQLVDDVASIITGASLARPLVLGHSMGGQLALVLAAARPELLAELVLLTPVPTTGLPLPAEVAPVFAAAATDASAREAIVDMATRRLADAERRTLLASAATVSATCMARTLETWTRGAPGTDLSGVTLPATIIGTDDGFLPQPLLKTKIADRLRAAELVHIPGVGHYPHLEATAELAGRLATILRRTGRAPSA